MSDARNLIHEPPQPATNVGRFLARRGVLVMKEFKEFGKIRCEFGPTLTITTLILAIAQSLNADRTFGVKLECKDSDDRTDSSLLDIDEIAEFLHAIKYIFNIAKEVRGQARDYTEFIYSTKDGVRVGFYQRVDGQQQAFIDVSPRGETIFISFDRLREVFNTIKLAREHLIEKGATVVPA
jgi:hypothetical protein